MTRAEHYRAAEKLLGGSRGSPLRAGDLAEAQIHALLATASFDVEAEAYRADRARRPRNG